MIRVMIAEDQAMVRGALAALLTLEGDIDVVAEVGRGDEVVEAALLARPDVALLDIEMPGHDGLIAAGALRERMPGCRVLILTTFRRPGYLRLAMERGAAGYLLKDAPPDELIRGVRAVARGETVLASDVAALLVRRVNAPEPALTEREVQILGLLADGLANKEMARRLLVSEATVKSHLAHIYTKLGVESRAGAVARAIEQRIIRA
jgi:DNA-binding NarL/FixJ family response regulator